MTWIIEDWRRVVAVSWSLWAQIVGLVALVAVEAIFAVTGRDTDPYRLWWVSVILLTVGTVGRLIQQPGRRRWSWLIFAAILGATVFASGLLSKAMADPREDAALEVAVPLIAKWEGKRNVAYRDIVGVWTVCYGSTRGVKAGDRYTDAQCLDLLRREVAEYRAGLHAYFTAETIAERLPPTRDAAYNSLAFNVGIYGAGRSTAVRRLNAGNITGGCEALTWWNKAGGRVVRGLVRRRSDERALCLVGVS